MRRGTRGFPAWEGSGARGLTGTEKTSERADNGDTEAWTEEKGYYKY